MPRDHRIYLDDMLQAIERIKEYTEDLDEEAFASDRKTQDAVIRNLEIIGEAARSIPDGTKAAMAEIEWRNIIGMRNLLIHEYFGVSIPIIWDIVRTKLDSLEEACRRVLQE